MSDFCVVIKIYNEFEMLEDCIVSLTKQTRLPKHVLIVDDGSPNPGVFQEIDQLSQKYPILNITGLRLPLKNKPNLDTVGRTWKEAWFKFIRDKKYAYFGMLDADTRLHENYYEVIITEMENNSKIGCASGAIIIKSGLSEYIEKINVGAKVGRKDARGSGKIIRTSLLFKVENDFPEVDWDTWINTKVKIHKMKSPQIDNVYMYQERPTTRVAGKDHYRNGRLTYHFGYNPILLALKMILAKKGAISILRGYLNARKDNWKLKDKEVRKYFGWRFFFHF
ncbi:MAG: glycosyltransferase family 2 protein [Candidatus Hodarchaeales archaeon]|jgi:glycosyltransferase involved in cell wall biosynthesis